MIKSKKVQKLFCVSMTIVSAIAALFFVFLIFRNAMEYEGHVPDLGHLENEIYPLSFVFNFICLISCLMASVWGLTKIRKLKNAAN